MEQLDGMDNKQREGKCIVKIPLESMRKYRWKNPNGIDETIKSKLNGSLESVRRM